MWNGKHLPHLPEHGMHMVSIWVEWCVHMCLSIIWVHGYEGLDRGIQ